jgi:hypothetical protein
MIWIWYYKFIYITRFDITLITFFRPYIFEVPAWFAHNHKAEQESAANDPRGPGKQTAYPYGTYGTSADYEPIKEPTKFGQIRNYLHPVKVKNPQHKPH